MIQPVNALSPKVSYRGRRSENENPINRRMERRLAILNAGGISVITGALTTAIARSYTASWKSAGLFGVGASVITMLFICPRFLYKSGVRAYARQREMDVFTKEKDVQAKLLSDVNDAIDNHKEDLNSKLDNYSKTHSAQLKI